MQDKDKIIEGLLRSKAQTIADRNERFAIIEQELGDLKQVVSDRITQLSKRINEVIREM